MIKASSKLILLLALAVPGVPAHAESAGEHPNPAVERSGDYLQVGIPLVALGLTFLLDGDDATGGASSSFAGTQFGPGTDWLRMSGSPRHDLLLAVGRTELATYSLKYSIDSERPNGGGQSFPSGHTSIAFAGAEFMRKQYGWKWGVPSYLAASYVGWSRVETRNHWASDVFAGAAIGILSNHDGLDFSLPLGRGGELSISPTFAPGLGTGALRFAPEGSVAALFEEPEPSLGLGLRIEVRF